MDKAVRVYTESVVFCGEEEAEFRDYSYKQFEIIEVSLGMERVCERYAIENLDYTCSLYKEIRIDHDQSRTARFELIRAVPYIDSFDRQIKEKCLERLIQRIKPANTHLRRVQS